MYKKLTPYLAEFFGTAVLSLVVLLSVVASQYPVSTPVLAAITLGIFAYLVGHISGAHLNPAITIGMWSVKRISWKPAIFYVIAQLAGAALAILVAHSFGIAQVAANGIPNTFKVASGEAVGALVFAFGVAAVMFGRVNSQATGIAIAGSFVIGSTLSAILGVGGILNPAVAFAVGAFNLAYVIGPIVGAVIGALAYKYLSEN